MPAPFSLLGHQTTHRACRYLESLSHCHDYVVCLFALNVRDDTSFDSDTVDSDALNTLFNIVRIYNLNVLGSFSELSGQL